MYIGALHQQESTRKKYCLNPDRDNRFVSISPNPVTVSFLSILFVRQRNISSEETYNVNDLENGQWSYNMIIKPCFIANGRNLNLMDGPFYPSNYIGELSMRVTLNRSPNE